MSDEIEIKLPRYEAIEVRDAIGQAIVDLQNTKPPSPRIKTRIKNLKEARKKINEVV